jgi:hypothetical protein
MIFRSPGESNDFGRASASLAQGEPTVIEARIVKVIMVGCLALFALLVTFDNLIATIRTTPSCAM